MPKITRRHRRGSAELRVRLSALAPSGICEHHTSAGMRPVPGLSVPTGLTRVASTASWCPCSVHAKVAAHCRQFRCAARRALEHQRFISADTHRVQPVLQLRGKFSRALNRDGARSEVCRRSPRKRHGDLPGHRVPPGSCKCGARAGVASECGARVSLGRGRWEW